MTWRKPSAFQRDLVPTWTRTGVPSKVAKRAWSQSYSNWHKQRSKKLWASNNTFPMKSTWGKICFRIYFVITQNDHAILVAYKTHWVFLDTGPFSDWFNYDRSFITCSTISANTGRVSIGTPQNGRCFLSNEDSQSNLTHSHTCIKQWQTYVYIYIYVCIYICLWPPTNPKQSKTSWSYKHINIVFYHIL